MPPIPLRTGSPHYSRATPGRSARPPRIRDRLGAGPSRDSGVSGDFQGVGGAVGTVCHYLADYMVLPQRSILAMAAWVQAAHLIGEGEDKGPWDQFPIMAVTSPEKRCGKSTMLDVLSFITPRADRGKFINPSPAVFYRTIEKCRPTIIMDESQSLKRRGSEASELLREMLNASTRRDERVSRCVGDNHEPAMFSIYSPKIFAQIGDPDGVLADRCLPIRVERKTNEKVKRVRYREVKERGEEIRAKLEQWAVENAERVTAIYEKLQPFDIENDRLADLLMPLQAVLTVVGAGALAMLEAYARTLDDKDRQAEMNSPGVRLLMTIRELFGDKANSPTAFIQSDKLIACLVARVEEPWGEWNHGRPISREKLASLLRPYGIRSDRTPDQKQTGYFARDFRDAWTRYLPGPHTPENPANRANPPTPARPPGYDAMLRKPRWSIFSRKVRDLWGHRCAVCYATGPLQVHHRTYERFGREELTDCLPLCQRCHPFADGARKGAKR